MTKVKFELIVKIYMVLSVLAFAVVIVLLLNMRDNQNRIYNNLYDVCNSTNAVNCQ